MKAVKISQIIIFYSIFFMSCANEIFVNPPEIKKIKKELITNGHSRIDDYFWMNDRENPEVIKHLEKENSYTSAVMEDYAETTDKLYKEIIGRIKQSDESVPYRDNGYYYFYKYTEGSEYPIYYRIKDEPKAKEEVLLDVNALAKDTKFCQVTSFSVSPDNKLIAYGLDTVGRRLYSIFIKKIGTEEFIGLPIKNTTGVTAWASDSKTFFYTQKDTQTLRPCTILKHKLGAEIKKDKLIYFEKDEKFSTIVYKTRSRKYILISSYSKTSEEYRFLDADKPDGEFKIIQLRVKDLEYSVSHFNDKFYILTNYKAKNFRLMETSINNTGIDFWKEVIPHREDVFLEDLEIFKKYFVLSERKNGLRQMHVFEWESMKDYYIDFGEEVYTADLGTNPEYETDLLRYTYSSLTTPSSIIDYNLNSRQKNVKKQQEVLGGFNSSDYGAKRLYVKSRDGKDVPVSLVYKKGIKLDGKNPLVLYGYGAYGISVDPNFSSMRLSLLNRGYIYAIAHVRGGQELGYSWYEDGKMLNKMHSFTDFIDCAEFLIEKKYTSPECLFAMGGSAGGLLVAAVNNMRPDLFRGVVALVPFVDIVTTMLDKSIPLTTSEFEEWGNPEDSVYYDYMLSYSPYDNVKKANYPAILVLAGLHDSQVQYWEPAKWVAKLREYNTGKNVILLQTNMQAGHGGASGRFEMYKEYALEYSFLLKLMKKKF
jgi:oligopeptidase B